MALTLNIKRGGLRAAPLRRFAESPLPSPQTCLKNALFALVPEFARSICWAVAGVAVAIVLFLRVVRRRRVRSSEVSP